MVGWVERLSETHHQASDKTETFKFVQKLFVVK